jgi:hypothetical protein
MQGWEDGYFYSATGRAMQQAARETGGTNMAEQMKAVEQHSDIIGKEFASAGHSIAVDVHDVFDRIAHHGCGLGLNDEGIAGLVQTLKDLGPDRWRNPTYRPAV